MVEGGEEETGGGGVRVMCGGGRRGGNRWGWGEGDVWWREEMRKQVGVG